MLHFPLEPHRRYSVNFAVIECASLVSVEGNGTPLQYSCLENPMDGGAWWTAVHGVSKSWTRLSNFTFTFHFHALEKEMATHSSVLARRIPGTGEPGGLPSMGSHRVGHDWRDLAPAAAAAVLSYTVSVENSSIAKVIFPPCSGSFQNFLFAFLTICWCVLNVNFFLRFMNPWCLFVTP